jgi:hypothetical protein
LFSLDQAVYKIRIDFGSDEFSAKVGERMKDRFLRRLASAGLADKVKITFVDNGHGVPCDFQLDGSPEDIGKAKAVLGVRETDDDCEQNQNSEI